MDQDDLRATLNTTRGEWYEYGSFGEPTFLGNTQSRIPATLIGNNRLWNGREYDAETGLYYYRTRYLDPRIGRFTTRDTIGIWGDPMNLGNGYAYVGNNPWTYVDPMGLGVDVVDVPAPGGKIYRHYYDTGSLFRAREYIGTYEFDPKDGASVQMANDLRRTQNFMAVTRDASGAAQVAMETVLRAHPLGDVTEAVTGKDLISGEELGPGGRALAVAAPLLGPLDDLNDARKVAKAANKVDDACDAVRAVGGVKYIRDHATKRTKQWSAMMKSEGEARALARTKLGSNPIEVEKNKWRSADQKWQYRAKPVDTSDRHIHLEELDPRTGEVLQNLHLRWPEGGGR